MSFSKLKIGLGIAVIALIVIVVSLVDTEPKSAYSSRVYTVHSGYGYEIRFEGKILIKQDHIPAVAEQYAFCSSEDATKIANLVISKLVHKENPSITQEEIVSEAIVLNCTY